MDPQETDPVQVLLVVGGVENFEVEVEMEGGDERDALAGPLAILEQRFVVRRVQVDRKRFYRRDAWLTTCGVWIRSRGGAGGRR